MRETDWQFYIPFYCLPHRTEYAFEDLNIIHLSDPVDVEVMFGSGGRYPELRAHRVTWNLESTQTDRQDLYSSEGIWVHVSMHFIPLLHYRYCFPPSHSYVSLHFNLQLPFLVAEIFPEQQQQQEEEKTFFIKT